MSLRLRPLRPLVLCCAAAVIAGSAAAQQPATPQGAPPQVPQGTVPQGTAPQGTTPQGATPPAQKPAAKPPAQQAGQPGKDPVVATVNGQQIRLSELEAAQQTLPQQYRNMPMQAVFPALLDRMIDGKLVVLEGRKAKVNEDPAFKKRMAFVEDQVLQD